MHQCLAPGCANAAVIRYKPKPPTKSRMLCEEHAGDFTATAPPTIARPDDGPRCVRPGCMRSQSAGGNLCRRHYDERNRPTCVIAGCGAAVNEDGLCRKHRAELSAPEPEPEPAPQPLETPMPAPPSPAFTPPSWQYTADGYKLSFFFGYIKVTIAEITPDTAGVELSMKEWSGGADVKIPAKDVAEAARVAKALGSVRGLELPDTIPTADKT